MVRRRQGSNKSIILSRGLGRVFGLAQTAKSLGVVVDQGEKDSNDRRLQSFAVCGDFDNSSALCSLSKVAWIGLAA